MAATPPEVPARYASVDSLQRLHADLIVLRDFIYAAANGDLSRQVPLAGYIGGALKTLQANLRHMTWQTKMVAAGDLTQRVDFMGAFSESFNAMLIQFDQTLKELVRKENELNKVNADLLNEIAIRKQTEATLRKSKEKMRKLALTDSLTGLYNRRYFNRLAKEAIIRALRYSRPLSIMVFDIDYFKQVNDTFGHNYGDLVLKEVAKVTREVLRSTDIPARYGGEEFIVLLYETPATEAAEVAERLRRQLEATTMVDSEIGPIKITASFGVSDDFGKIDENHGDRILSEFVTTADRAMYASKNSGRNKTTVYTSKSSPAAAFRSKNLIPNQASREQGPPQNQN